MNKVAVMIMAILVGACGEGPLTMEELSDSERKAVQEADKTMHKRPTTKEEIEAVSKGLYCMVYLEHIGCQIWAPHAPPGGRFCDWRGNTTIFPGETAVYTGEYFGGWCVTIPSGVTSNMEIGSIFGDGYFHAKSIKNRSTSAYSTRIGCSGAGLTGSCTSYWMNSDYPTLPFVPKSFFSAN